MKLADTITRVFAPHLEANTVDAVARHLCAKHGVREVMVLDADR